MQGNEKFGSCGITRLTQNDLGKMNAGFQNKNFQVSTSDGRNFVLLQSVTYCSKAGVVYVIPAGATSDGASTPAELWPTIPPFGTYWQAAFLHDAAYRDTLQLADGTWATLTKAQCDSLLDEAMMLAGVGPIMRGTIYEGVNWGGESSFNTDRMAGRASFMSILSSATN